MAYRIVQIQKSDPTNDGSTNFKTGDYIEYYSRTDGAFVKAWVLLSTIKTNGAEYTTVRREKDAKTVTIKPADKRARLIKRPPAYGAGRGFN